MYNIECFLLGCTKTLKLSFPVNSLKWVKFWTILQLQKEKCGAFSFAGGEGWSQVAKSRS